MFPLVFILIVWTLLFLNILRHSIVDERHKVDAIVVMGASQWNKRPSPVYKERLDHALSLYNQGLSKYIVLTGGIAEGETISESRVGKTYLLGKGVKSESILIEEIGTTSLQSMLEVNRILEEYKINSIILVSHGYHIMRLKQIAKDLKIKTIYSSPVKTRPTENNIRSILRESAILIVYYITKLF